MAETVLQETLAEAGLSDLVRVESSGTSRYHIDEDMDARARLTLQDAGYRPGDHRGSQATAQILANTNLVLAMDNTNHQELLALATRGGVSQDHIRLFRSFDPQAAALAEVPDPYYGQDDGFRDVLAIVQRAAAGVTRFVAAELGEAKPGEG